MTLVESMAAGRSRPSTRSLVYARGALFKVYAYVGLLLVSGALQRPIGGDTLHGTLFQTVKTQNVQIQLIGAAFYLVTAALFLADIRRISLAPKLWPLLVLTALAPLSAFWSTDGTATLTRSAGLVGCTLFALVAIHRLGVDGVARLLANFCVLFVLANFILSIVLPGYTHHGASELFSMHAGALKGTYVHKNLFARTLSFAIIVIAFLGHGRIRSRLLYVFTLLVGAYLLFATGSAKTYISVPLSLLAGYGLMSFRTPSGRALGLLFVSLLAIAVTVSGAAEAFSSAILGAVGRDPTLSARTQIWGAVLRAAAEHPLLGGGYEAAWGNGVGTAVRLAIGFDAGHAHNGFIQTFVDLGAVGLALALIFLVDMAASLVTASRPSNPKLFGFAVAWLAMFVLNNLAGSFLMQTSDIYWFQLILTPYLVAAAIACGPEPECIASVDARGRASS